jgi:hypothetical protein
LHVLINRQATRFVPLDAPPGLAGLTTVTAADLDADGAIDLVAGDAQGRISRVTRRGSAWQTVTLETWPGAPLTRVLVADLDNNGALDIVASRANASRVWLATETYALAAASADVDGDAWAVRDTNGDGTLDLIGVSASGMASRWLGRGTRGYHWKTFTTRAQQNAGDQSTSVSGLAPQSTWRASCGPTAFHRRSSPLAWTTRSWPSSG